MTLPKENGNIKIVKHTNNNFIVPIVNNVIEANYQGKTCVITRTNEEAILIAGLLNKHGVNAQLIQTLDDFKLINLYELKEFYSYIDSVDNVVITEEAWNSAIEKLKEKFKQSINLELVLNTLNMFKESSNKLNYVSDLWNFLVEANISDFVLEGPIYVSTLHKSKGKEFDNVILLLDNNYQSLPPQELRAIYVGLTRAKTNLEIHTNHHIFDKIEVDNLIKIIDYSPKELVDRITIQFGYKDVRLGYFEYVQRNVQKCMPGDELILNEDGTVYCKERKVLQFSSSAKQTIESHESQGYKLSSMKIRHMVYWYDREKQQQFLIILPEVTFDYVGVDEKEEAKE